ncbi:hypothetical protein H0O00_01965 [Candidatus Micrarchaeota archaeon]|nr:hypothetical protein [Candidatus Micrarchaeota archaeon]
MTNGNQMLYLGLGALHFMLLAVLFYLSGMWPDATPLSIEAFSQPFQGDFAMMNFVLVALAVMDIGYYYFAILPQILPTPKNHPTLLAFPAVWSALGLVIGLLNANPWVAIPFFMVGMISYVYAFWKVTQAPS